MPEKTEDLIQSQVKIHSGNFPAVLGQNNRTSKKRKKILKLFRSLHKEITKDYFAENGCEKVRKKQKHKRCMDLEERKELFLKNMENSWTELPNTLRAKKEKISREILLEFHELDSTESDRETSKTQSFKNSDKNCKNSEIFKPSKSYTLSDGIEEVTCEFFRKKEEHEMDAPSLTKTKFSKEFKKSIEESKPAKFLNHNKKNLYSKDICKDLMENNQILLEKIRQLSEDEMDRGSSNGRKNESFDVEAAVKKIDLYFYDLTTENDAMNSSEASGEDISGYSRPYVNVTFPSSNCKEKSSENVAFEKIKRKLFRDLETQEGTKVNLATSDSAKILENGSSANVLSASKLSQKESASKKSWEQVMSDFHSEYEKFRELNTEITHVNESRELKSRLETETNYAENSENIFEHATKNESSISCETDDKDNTQYSDILFSVPHNILGLFVNEDFREDSQINTLEAEKQKDSETKDVSIVYQELDFVGNCGAQENSSKETIVKFGEIKKDSAKEEMTQEKSIEKIQETKNLEQPTLPVLSSLSEEQKAKKKSAEAIAKELSSHIFSKRSPIQESIESCDEKKIVTSSVQMTDAANRESLLDGNVGSDSENRKSEKEKSENLVASEAVKIDRIAYGEEKMNKGEDKKESLGDLQYFSVTDWRKAMSLGSKRGIGSIAMETIAEEPEADTSTKLAVLEILRRFKELENKNFDHKLWETEDERTDTLKKIHHTLDCLVEKVRYFENINESNSKNQQYLENSRITELSPGAWTGRSPAQRTSYSTPVRGHQDKEEITQASINDGKHSLLQFAIHHFRQSPEKFEMLKTSDGSISGSLKVIESKNKKNKDKGKGGGKDSSEWTWKEQVDLVKFTSKPIEQSLLQLDTPELNDLAVESFICLMRYMGDLPMPTDISEVKCVYTILMHCHKFEQLRDEVYCQLMKQTTNNKSIQQESCQRGWRLFSIVAAYFVSSDTLKPFLFKYLETAAYDKRRAYHGTAMVCLQNLRKTFKYGGRKNVPSVEEITAISAGRNSKRQIYRLPGGTEKVVNTKSTTVIQDVIEELCVMINVTNPQEMEEFSVYCIVEGDTFTMPLAREEYILDVTTELHKNHQVFYLIFCRSVWYFPLRLDSQLYVEVVFNQIAPDYLEGLLLIMPGESLEQEVIYDISKIAALLHRAADMTHVPSMKETKFLLPKPALSVRDVKPSQWVNMVQSNWQDCENLTTIQAKAQVIDVLSKWPLFGSSFFAVKRSSESKERTDHILALNRGGVHFIDLITHETLLHYPFSEVISTRKVKSEDGTLFLDMKCGNLMQQRITRLQTDQAHEISRLIRQYITMQQRMGVNQM